MITYLKNMEGWKHKDLKSKDFDSIKELFDKAFKRVNMFVDFRTDLVEGSSKKSGDELEQEVTKKQKVDDVQEIAEVDNKIYKEGKKSYYQIMRSDGKYQVYMLFSQMLKSFDRGDLEDLYKLVKAKYKSTIIVEDLDLLLWGNLKTMFKPDVEDVIWRIQQGYNVLEWKLYDSYGMLEKKLQIDYESEMAYQLCKLIVKQLKNQ
ncbi:hypothetical protein Tco_1011805 [Tanacetum coccineum]